MRLDLPPRVERRLAVILAADVAGYSRLMGDDEEEALRTLRGHRQVFDEIISNYRGRIFNTAGDSVVAEFAGPVDAVRCAIEAQQAIEERNSTLPDQQRMLFRIGINLGDVMVQGTDLLGDGVNVAARLEGIADPGGICLARSVYEPVRAALPLDYKYLGERGLKNIAEPVAVYRVGRAKRVSSAGRETKRLVIAGAVAGALFLAVSAAWLTVHTWPPATAPPSPARIAAITDKPALAVLPFTNMSGDPQQDYFTDGMTEDLIIDLSKLSGLLVTPRNSSFVYKGRNVGSADVARELGVRYVLEGSIRKAGDRLRITAQLSDAGTGQHLWSERYDRELKDMFDLQDEVRQKIVSVLAVRLSPAESARLAHKATRNVEAYDFYARGLEYLNRFTPTDIREARAMFLKAVILDPSFARAYGQIANTYSLEVESGVAVSPDEAAANGVLYGQRAVALDDSMPELRWPLSRAYAWQRHYDRALAEIEKALAVNPNYADGLAYYAQLLSYVGRAPEGLIHVQQAMRVNPHYPFWYVNIYGNLQFLLGNDEQAVISIHEALDRNPNWFPARRILIAAYGQLGRIGDAQWEMHELATAGSPISAMDIEQNTAYQHEPYRQRFFEGLRKAGVPE